MAKRRILRVALLLSVMAALSVTLSSCTGGISLSVVPETYKFPSAGSKDFSIQVSGIGEVPIDNVYLTSETNFKFPGGVPNCIGEKVGKNLPPCIETVSLPTYKSGLSVKLIVTVKNLKKEVQLSS